MFRYQAVCSQLTPLGVSKDLTAFRSEISTPLIRPDGRPSSYFIYGHRLTSGIAREDSPVLESSHLLSTTSVRGK